MRSIYFIVVFSFFISYCGFSKSETYAKKDRSSCPGSEIQHENNVYQHDGNVIKTLVEFDQKDKKLFAAKRLNRAKDIRSFQDQWDIQVRAISIATALEKTLTILKLGRSEIMTSTHPTTNAAVLAVLEQSAYLADLILNFSDWVVGACRGDDVIDLVRWALDYGTTEITFYDEDTKKLVNMARQEIGLIDKEPNYVNPSSIALSDDHSAEEKLQITIAVKNRQIVDEGCGCRNWVSTVTIHNVPVTIVEDE